jgi:hypothetical protein
MVHLFSLAIYVNDKTVVTGTKADKQNTRYADAVVPITKWESDTNVVVTVCKTADVVVLSFFTSASTFFARNASVVLSPKSEKSDIITSKVLSMS